MIAGMFTNLELAASSKSGKKGKNSDEAKKKVDDKKLKAILGKIKNKSLISKSINNLLITLMQLFF